MSKYECLACGYIYDPAVGDLDSGIEPGTRFEDLPDDWVCPECGVGKEMFESIASEPADEAASIPKPALEPGLGMYQCLACGYVYDPAVGDPAYGSPGAGIPPGTAFEDLPEDWVCPECGVGKDMLELME